MERVQEEVHERPLTEILVDMRNQTESTMRLVWGQTFCIAKKRGAVQGLFVYNLNMKIPTIVILSLLISCGIFSVTPLRLQDRTLLIDPRSASLIYPYMGEECKHPDRRIFRGCDPVRKIIKYDLSDEGVRRELIGAKFECQSPIRFKY